MDNVKYVTKLISGENLYYLKDTEARANLIDKTEKGAAGGVATLDNSGKVPSSQLPSYVDDVIEGYYNNTDNKFYSIFTPGEDDEPDVYSDEITGETGKIYVDLSSNLSYRWSGSTYILMTSGGGSAYTLPIASANTLGGVKVGTNLSIDNNGVLSTDNVMALSGYTVIDSWGTEEEHYDLNDLTTIGQYAMTDVEKYGYFDNTPSISTSIFSIEVSSPISGIVKQRFSHEDYRVCFSRSKDSNGVWSDWARVEVDVNTSVLKLKNYTNIQSWASSEQHYSLNSLTETGTYGISNNANAAYFDDRPVTSNTAFYIVVARTRANTPYVKQRYQQSNSTIVYERYSSNSGSTWGSWYKVQQNLEKYLNFDGQSGTEITSNTDLDTLLTAGTYYCSSEETAQTLLNCPYTKSNFKLIVMYDGQTNYGRQILQGYKDLGTYVRAIDGGNIIGEWEKVFSLDPSYHLLTSEGVGEFTPSGTGWYRIGKVGRTKDFDLLLYSSYDYDYPKARIVGYSTGRTGSGSSPLPAWDVLQLYGTTRDNAFNKIRLVYNTDTTELYIEVYNANTNNRKIVYKFFEGTPYDTPTAVLDTPTDGTVIKEHTIVNIPYLFDSNGNLTTIRQGRTVYAGSPSSSSHSMNIGGSNPGDVRIYTLTRNISSLSISGGIDGEQVTIIYTSDSARTVAIANSSTMICPGGANLSLSVPANGFVALLVTCYDDKYYIQPLNNS